MNPRHSKGSVFSFWLQWIYFVDIITDWVWDSRHFEWCHIFLFNALFITAPNLMLLLIPNISLFLKFPCKFFRISYLWPYLWETYRYQYNWRKFYRYRQLKETAEGVGAIAQLFSLVEMKRRGENSHVLRRKK